MVPRRGHAAKSVERYPTGRRGETTRACSTAGQEKGLRITAENVLLIIPTYNEAENISALLADIERIVPAIHVLVVDDNSEDRTGDVVEHLAKLHCGGWHVLRRAGKLGLGTAYIAGFQWALERDYQAVIEMDADFSHDPHHLPQIICQLNAYDMVIGSRYVRGGGTRNWSLVRRLISWGGCGYARVILGLPIADPTGGFNGLRRQVLDALNLESIKSEGYAFQIELKYRVYRQGFDLREIPITFWERRVGKSKMSWRIFLEAVGRVWALRWSRS